MITELSIAVGTPLAGWLALKTVDTVKQVYQSKAEVEELKADVTYIRTRVDSIFDHLIRRGAPPDRG